MPEFNNSAFAPGTHVRVRWAPEYGTGTVVRGTICPVTRQIAVQFPGEPRESWYWPESLEAAEENG